MLQFLLDVGSTFVKYAVWDDVKTEYILSDKVTFPPPVCEVPFLVDRGRIDAVMRDVLEIALQSGCKQVFISVQMHGYLLQNAAGQWSDYFSWRSGGADTESEALTAIDFAARGTSLKGNLPIAKLYKERETLRGATFYTLGSYLAYLLTGQNATHKTDALASGFYAADTLAPDTKTVEGLTLPKAHAEVCALGTYRGMEIFTPVGDHAASVYGSGVQTDAYLLNIGTTSQIAYVGEGDAPCDGWEKRPYFEKGKTLFTRGNLFYGLFGDAERYCAEAAKAISALPRRARLLVGGGGAAEVLERLHNVTDMPCETVGCDIGLAGLARLASPKKIRMGTMLSEVPFTNMPLVMQNAGLDFLIVDNEHGAFDYGTLAKLFTVSRLANFQTVVRLPDNSRAWITKCVDAGADGFLLPMTNTAEEIAKVVEYAKYAPVGKRGISTMRAHTLYNPPALAEYMPAANERVRVYAQIETAKGVANIAEILAEKGVDGVFIGPNDLACDLGCIGNHAPIFDAIERVSAAAKAAGKPWGIITASAPLLAKAKACSVDMVSCGSELNMLQSGCLHIRNIEIGERT